MALSLSSVSVTLLSPNPPHLDFAFQQLTQSVASAVLSDKEISPSTEDLDVSELISLVGGELPRSLWPRPLSAIWLHRGSDSGSFLLCFPTASVLACSFRCSN